MRAFEELCYVFFYGVHAGFSLVGLAPEEVVGIFNFATCGACFGDGGIDAMHVGVDWEPPMDEFGESDSGRVCLVAKGSAMGVPVDAVG